MKTMTFGRLSTLLVAFLVTIGFAASASAANSAPTVHSLSGNARTNIGSLPIPINFTAPPTGNILATPSATIRVFGPHMAGAPAKVQLQAGQLTFAGSGVFPVAPFNPSVLQVGTALQLQLPAGKAVFEAGGRTGAATVTWCPGSTVPDTSAGNPGCATASAGAIPGRMTYTATSNQFGGPARGAVQGTADVALGPSALAPCSYGTNTACTVRFVAANPAPLGVNGGPFNVSVGVSSPSLNPGNFGIVVLGGGTIVGIVTTLGPAGLTNNGVSYGGPNTSGSLKIEQPAALGGAETFTLLGSDGRITAAGTMNGQGALSLVSGALSTRAVSGPNANRGWINLVVGAPLGNHVPMLPALGVAALVGLTGLSGAFVLRRKKR